MNNLIIAKNCTLGMYDGSDYSEQELISGRAYKVNVTLEAEYICFDGKYISMETDSGLELFFKPQQINDIKEIEE